MARPNRHSRARQKAEEKDPPDGRLFEPLGMISTGYLRTTALAAAAATGHRRSRRGWRPVTDYDRSLIGPGAVRSTITDVARYAQALLRRLG
jgi:CubicO group peptidase (beta-lactamase class C family)